MEITTERLLLREVVEGDAAALAAYQGDPRSAEFRPDAVPDFARKLVGNFRLWAVEHPRRNYQLAVALRETPRELIGCCGVRGERLEAGNAEFGIELDPRWWGRGMATEASRAILGFGFRELGLEEVRALSVTENTRLSRLVTALGFTVLDRRPGPAWMAVRGWSQTEWQLSRERWNALEAA
jgi:RimJ/RimL family protein N-acetyltransferase